MTRTLVNDNIRILKQGIELLKQIEDHQYSDVLTPLTSAGLGSHFRHSIDHYLSFLNGWESGEVDYDARERDEQLEKNRLYAIEVLEHIVAQLAGVDEDKKLRVQIDGGSEGDNYWSDSTVKRELQFLLSHTIHHYALKAMILRTQGIDPGEEFGVAPSTLRYREKLAKCAQ